VTAESQTPSRRLSDLVGIRADLLPITLAVAGLVLLRLLASALLPLSSDEAYYWLWSRHLEAGYLDHPPAIAWLIRFGTAIFGDTPLGVRLGATLSSAAATWFVWRAGAQLLHDEAAGARAALWFNLTLMVAVEMLAATPDAPALLTSAALLQALVRIRETSDGRWWIAAGIAGGFGLLSKFTMFFLAAGVLGWMVFDPRARRWWVSPWPYLAALLAVFLYAPNLLWNAEHNWPTYLFQFDRVGRGHFDARFLAEFLAAQLGLCSPFIFLLGLMGLARTTRIADLRLVGTMLWPGIAYFVVHALHDRVQANWPSFLLPAFCVAAVAAANADWSGQVRSFALLARRAAAPVAAAVLMLAYLQALFGILPIGRSDPLSRLLGVGLEDVAANVDTTRARSGAGAILTSDYASTAWFGFYLPSHAPIVATSESERWTFARTAPRTLLAGPLLYVAEARLDRHSVLAAQFTRIVPLGQIDRKRGGVVIAQYNLYRVSGFHGAAFGHMLP
jgi:4-amino-4-deoxy-L-arabinose transferase-like glycosyltransferase